MIWRKIFAGALLFIACDKEEVVKTISNEEKNIVIEKIVLFGSSEQVTDYYANHNFETIWRTEINRSDLISAIIDSQYDGVLLDDYPLQELIQAHWNYSGLSIAQLKKIDVLFTQTYFKLAKQLATGKINPKKLYGDWEPYLQQIAYDSILSQSIDKQKIYQNLEEIKPKSTLYKVYKKAFAKYVPVTTTDTVSAEGLMRKKIWVNFERTKWLPSDLGTHYVWVNLPEFQLKVISNDELVATHKVIVGTKERRTPILSSAFSGIIVNPKWTVPPTILKKDVVPKATANREYFSSNRLTIFDKKTGKVIDPYDWNPENYNAYRYVQQTGPLNSLGQLKFDFPNNHMVYLHDTNNKRRFAERNRALSSGCVRVEDPFRMAEIIFDMEQKDILRSQLDTLVVHEKTKNFKLNKKVNVHQVYFTAVIDDTEQIKILNDVYSLDNILYRRLIQ